MMGFSIEINRMHSSTPNPLHSRTVLVRTYTVLGTYFHLGISLIIKYVFLEVLPYCHRKKFHFSSFLKILEVCSLRNCFSE